MIWSFYINFPKHSKINSFETWLKISGNNTEIIVESGARGLFKTTAEDVPSCSCTTVICNSSMIKCLIW